MMTNFGPMVYFVTPILLLTASGLSIFLIRRRRLRLQQDGIVWLQTFKLLISHIQRHRGLSTHYLSGYTQSAVLIPDTQAEISKDFEHIALEQELSLDNTNWSGITQHWARLVSSYDSLTIDNNIHQHTCLIRSILSVIEDISTRYCLQKLSRVGVSWRDLLTLAELLGQSRALGVVVLANYHSSGDMKRRLNRVLHDILLKAEPLESSNVRFISSYLQIANSLLEPEKPSMTSVDFFDRASLAIDQLYDLFDKDIKRVAYALQR